MFHQPVCDADRKSDGDPPRDASRHRDRDDVWVHLQYDLIGDEEEEDVDEDRREEREEQMQRERDKIQERSQEEIHQRE